MGVLFRRFIPPVFDKFFKFIKSKNRVTFEKLLSIHFYIQFINIDEYYIIELKKTSFGSKKVILINRYLRYSKEYSLIF